MSVGAASCTTRRRIIVTPSRLPRAFLAPSFVCVAGRRFSSTFPGQEHQVAERAARGAAHPPRGGGADRLHRVHHQPQLVAEQLPGVLPTYRRPHQVRGRLASPVAGLVSGERKKRFCHMSAFGVCFRFKKRRRGLFSALICASIQVVTARRAAAASMCLDAVDRRCPPALNYETITRCFDKFVMLFVEVAG